MKFVTSLGTPQDVRSKLALEWKLIECISHKYDKAGRSDIVVHLNRSGYRPTRRGSVKDDLCPVGRRIKKRDLINAN